MMHNFIAYFRKGRDFLKSYWAKWPRKQVASFHGRTVKGEESNIFTCKSRSIVFKTLGLIKLNRFLSYTNHESGKFQSFYVQNCVTIQLTVRAWSHEPGKQYAWTVCYPLSCFSLGSFAGPPGKRDYLENFHPWSRHHNTGIPADRVDSVVIQSQSWFLFRLTKVSGSLQSEPARLM